MTISEILARAILPFSACVALALGSLAQHPAESGSAYSPPVAEASEEGRLAMERFELAPGLKVELFAAEPMLANPVCFYADYEGRFFVGETFRHYAGVGDMRDHMEWLDEDLANQTVAERLAMLQRHVGDDYDANYGTEHERVRLIRDTNGDGVADEATVFADGFKDHAAGIGAGLLSYKGDVYYTCIPDLWLLRDADADGVADERRKLSTGYGVNIALLGHDLHGLRIGPDRRLYFSCGDRGFHVETENGTLAHPHAGAVLRCNLDGSGLEVWHTGLRNPQELVFDDYGNLFTGENNSDGGDQARWVNIVEGGESGWRYSYQWITEPVARGPWNGEQLWFPPFEGQAAYLVPPIANLGHGPSGLAYYPGTGLTADYAGHFFLADFRGDASYSGIHSFTVQPKGAFFELGPVSRFVWNTLVTDCDFGPDGALYFTDWVHGWNKTGKGRLYRARIEAAEGDEASDPAQETSRLLAEGMQQRATDELGALLAHADQRVRQEAHFALADRTSDGVEVLVKAALGGDTLLSRLHAIWGLGIVARDSQERDAPDRERRFALFREALTTLVLLTGDPDPEVRAQALRVIGDEELGAEPGSGGPEAIVRALADEEPRVRFFAALAAGRLKIAQALGPLVRVIEDAGEEDPNLRHAGIMGLLGCAGDRELARLSDHASPHVRIAVAVVWRRRGDALVQRLLKDAEPRVVLEAARAIHDVPIVDALPALAAHPLSPSASPALARRVLSANRTLGDAQALAGVAARADFGPALRVEALEFLSAWSDPVPRDPVTNAWSPLEARPSSQLSGLAARMAAASGAGPSPIDEAPESVAQAFASFAVAAGAADQVQRFESWLSDTDRPSAVRIAAFEALSSLGAEGQGERVRAALGDPDGNVRAAALTQLEALRPGEVLPSLAPILAQGEIAERRAAYRILAQSPTPDARALLIDQLEALTADLIPAELALDLTLAIEAQADPVLDEALATYRAPRARDPLAAPYIDGLFGGDAERGRAVFQRLDLSCARCHRTSSGGADQVGPSLEELSKRLSRLQVLESIVDPNRKTTPGYAATVFFMTDGRIVSGRIVSESPESVQLLNSEGEIVGVSVAEIDERRPDLSAMPENLAASLTREEMRDLLEYLDSL